MDEKENKRSALDADGQKTAPREALSMDSIEAPVNVLHGKIAQGSELPFVARSTGKYREGRGFSSEYTTQRCLMPRAPSSRRMMRAKGQACVLARSATRKAEGSSLLPAPMAEMIGTSKAFARQISSILALTVSMASAI